MEGIVAGLKRVVFAPKEGREGVGLALDLLEEVAIHRTTRDHATIHRTRHTHRSYGTCTILQLAREERGEGGVRLEGVTHFIHVAFEQGSPHLVDRTTCPHRERARVDGTPALGKGNTHKVPTHRLTHPSLGEHCPRCALGV